MMFLGNDLFLMPGWSAIWDTYLSMQLTDSIDINSVWAVMWPPKVWKQAVFCLFVQTPLLLNISLLLSAVKGLIDSVPPIRSKH